MCNLQPPRESRPVPCDQEVMQRFHTRLDMQASNTTNRCRITICLTISLIPGLTALVKPRQLVFKGEQRGTQHPIILSSGLSHLKMPYSITVDCFMVIVHFQGKSLCNDLLFRGCDNFSRISTVDIFEATQSSAR